MPRIHLPVPSTLALPLLAILLTVPANAQKAQGSAPKKRSVASQNATVGADGIADFDFTRIKVVHRPKAPAYPAEAKMAGIQGTVVVEIIIDQTGVPTQTRVIEGPEALRETAVAYAKTWRFAPAMVDHKAVTARFKLVMPFRLKEDPEHAWKSEGTPERPGTYETQSLNTPEGRVTVRRPLPPRYPEVARLAKVQGMVVVKVQVDAQGVPTAAEAIQGPDELRACAVEYVRTWRFQSKSGAPTGQYTLRLPFKLE